MCRDEILEDIQTLTETGLDRQLDGLTVRIGHETTHSGQLFDLLVGTTGSGICHHVDVVVAVKALHQLFGNLLVRILPHLDDCLVTLFLCHHTTHVQSTDLLDLLLCLRDDFLFLRRNDHIRNRYRHRCLRRIAVTESLDRIQRLCCLGRALVVDAFFQNLLQLATADMEINLQLQEIVRIGTVYKSKILRKNLVEDETSECGLDHTGLDLAIGILTETTDLDPCMKRDLIVLIGDDRLVHILEILAFARLRCLITDTGSTLLCQIVDTEDHILRRYRYGTTVGRLQQVVR